ncbi:MAG: hypothetical protein Kow0090_15980 [Myxococcota bacterium]
MRQLFIISLFGCFLLAIAALGGCRKPDSDGRSKASSGESVRNSVGESVAVEKKAYANRVVFINMKEACACTKRRIDATWDALQSALPKNRPVEVETIYWGEEDDKVRRFHNLRAFRVLPAVFLFDGGGNLIAMLEGEVKAEKFREFF